jgi:branched-chain amino acid transport system ATP-binding protein
MTFALEIKNLCKSFGGIKVTQDVSFSVKPGERRLIIGPNGAGKTTLFNQISGELKPDSGSIRVFGEDLTFQPVHRRAHAGVSRTYQIITLFPKDTLLHNVVLSLLGVSKRRFQAFSPLTVNDELFKKRNSILIVFYYDIRKINKVSVM